MKLHDLSTEGAGNAYPLPTGWGHGEEATVIGLDYGYVRVLGDGRETTVFIVNIDSGWDEWVYWAFGDSSTNGLCSADRKDHRTPTKLHG